MVEFKGLNEVIERLDQVADVTKLQNAINKSVLSVERDAKQIAPKDNGGLRNSIESKVETTNDSIKGYVFTPLEYAPYIEFGTGLFAEEGNGRQTPWSYQDDDGNWHTTTGQPPQPFMRPALSQNKQNILSFIQEAIKWLIYIKQ